VIYERCSIPDVILCKPKVFEDARGYFTETFRQDQLDAFLGFKINFCQDNQSMSTYGVVRGLHFQRPPFAQTKLVRVLQGKILDVAVDVRRNSPSFGKHVSVVLSEENKHQLLVPRGFAHGFAVLSEKAVFAYKCDQYYAPEHEAGIFYKDEQLNIDWQLPAEAVLTSEKDRLLPSFEQANCFEASSKLYSL